MPRRIDEPLGKDAFVPDQADADSSKERIASKIEPAGQDQIVTSSKRKIFVVDRV